MGERERVRSGVFATQTFLPPQRLPPTANRTLTYLNVSYRKPFVQTERNDSERKREIGELVEKRFSRRDTVRLVILQSGKSNIPILFGLVLK